MKGGRKSALFPLILILSNFPAELVAFCTGAAALGWILFSRSQKGRQLSGPLGWLSLPFLSLMVLYTWYSFIDIPIDQRAVHARIGIIAVSLSQALVLIILSLTSRNKNRRGK
jgi:energy-coupling factor transporter transmembrane protein EcfT